jgi:hypothetical protein
MIDYKKLLWKYIQHVCDCEGIHYIEAMSPLLNTPEEIQELHDLFDQPVYPGVDTELAQLLRASDMLGNIREPWIDAPILQTAKWYGLVEDYQLVIGGNTGTFQRLNAKGMDEREKLLKGE